MEKQRRRFAQQSDSVPTAQRKRCWQKLSALSDCRQRRVRRQLTTAKPAKRQARLQLAQAHRRRQPCRQIVGPQSGRESTLTCGRLCIQFRLNRHSLTYIQHTNKPFTHFCAYTNRNSTAQSLSVWETSSCKISAKEFHAQRRCVFERKFEMRSTKALYFRAASAVRETLAFASPFRSGVVGTHKLLAKYKDTSEWSNTLVGFLGADFRAAGPAEMSTHYDGVDMSSLSKALMALVHGDVGADGSAKNVQRWMNLMSSCGETAVDRYVGEVLQSCHSDATELLPQPPLKFSLGDLEVVSIPDHALRCGGALGLLDVVVEESKPAAADELYCGQVVGEMIAAAMVNVDRASAVPPVFGIRVVGARWTFFRVDFTRDYLDRLNSYSLLPDDRFTVKIWGGPLSSKKYQRGVKWGLDYNSPEERVQILRMVLALSREADAVM